MSVEAGPVSRILALPPSALPAERIRQILAGLRVRFGESMLAELTIQVIPELSDHYRGILGDTAAIASLSELSLFAAAEVIIALPQMVQPMDLASPNASMRGLLVCWPTARAAQNFVLSIGLDADVFVVDRSGGVRPAGRVISVQDDPGIDSHVFNRLGPREVKHATAFTHFPYGYLYRDTSWGPIDDFGHRGNPDYASLANRPPHHKVVTCHGGSAAWGWGCLPGQVWTDYLAERLNGWAADARRPECYTVLNLAAPGHVALNEIITHVLHGHQTRPDIVISLNGGNDLWVGQGSDPNLLVRHQITYQYEHTEPWSRLLHDSADRPGSQPDVASELKVINQLTPVLRAYVARMRQFRDLVEGAGSQFVWALQPTMHSKPDWSPLEKEALVHWGKREKAVRENMARLYDLLDRELPATDRAGFFSLDKVFADHGAEEALFWDFIHPTPDGHAEIAEYVFGHLLDRVLKAPGVEDC